MVDNNVKTNTGIDGNRYTTAVSNDKLTNKDFLKLMLAQLKLQDPTKPMDSAKMLSTQLQMSTIETNLQLSKSMKALKSSIASMALSNAVDFIHKKIDAFVNMPVKDSDGNILKDKNNKTITKKVKASFYIKSVQIRNGVTLLESNELLGFKDRIKDVEKKISINYDYKTGQIKNSDGTLSDYYIRLSKYGRFDTDTNGKIVIVDKDGNIKKPEFKPDGSDVKTPKFAFSSTDAIYSKDVTFIKYEDIVKIY